MRAEFPVWRCDVTRREVAILFVSRRKLEALGSGSRRRGRRRRRRRRRRRGGRRRCIQRSVDAGRRPGPEAGDMMGKVVHGAGFVSGVHLNHFLRTNFLIIDVLSIESMELYLNSDGMNEVMRG